MKYEDGKFRRQYIKKLKRGMTVDYYITDIKKEKKLKRKHLDVDKAVNDLLSLII